MAYDWPHIRYLRSWCWLCAYLESETLSLLARKTKKLWLTNSKILLWYPWNANAWALITRDTTVMLINYAHVCGRTLSMVCVRLQLYRVVMLLCKYHSPRFELAPKYHCPYVPHQHNECDTNVSMLLASAMDLLAGWKVISETRRLHIGILQQFFGTK